MSNLFSQDHDCIVFQEYCQDVKFVTEVWK